MRVPQEVHKAISWDAGIDTDMRTRLIITVDPDIECFSPLQSIDSFKAVGKTTPFPGTAGFWLTGCSKSFSGGPSLESSPRALQPQVLSKMQAGDIWLAPVGRA